MEHIPYERYEDAYDSGCPDLISRADIIYDIQMFSSVYHTPTIRRCVEEIKRAKTVAAEPVRHAAWEYFADTNMYGCSVCKARVTRGLVELGRYCRFCGAKMDLDHLGDTTAMVEKEDSR
jgi:hypothetical protein